MCTVLLCRMSQQGTILTQIKNLGALDYCPKGTKTYFDCMSGTGENLEVVRAEFSTLSQAVLLITPKWHSLQSTTFKVENSAQVLSC